MQSRSQAVTERVLSGQDGSAWALHAAHCRGWSRCGDGLATSSIAAVLLPHVRLSHVAVMAGCDCVGRGSESVGDGGHQRPPSCRIVALWSALQGGGQALFGVHFSRRLFSGKLSLHFVIICCIKNLSICEQLDGKERLLWQNFAFTVCRSRHDL